MSLTEQQPAAVGSHLRNTRQDGARSRATCRLWPTPSGVEGLHGRGSRKIILLGTVLELLAKVEAGGHLLPALLPASSEDCPARV